MAIRTYAQLQTDYADNAPAGLISAADGRNFIDSVYNWINKTVGGDIYYNAGNVGIGDFSGTTPDGPLHIRSGSAGVVTAASWADELVIEGDGSAGITILTPGGVNDAGLYFGKPGDSSEGGIVYFFDGDGGNGILQLKVGGNGNIFTFFESGKLDIAGNRFRMQTASDGLANNAAGSVGDMAFGTDTNKYLYIWFATNTPSRVQLNTW